MGFSDVVTQLIMFIAVVTVSVSLIFVFTNQVNDSSSSVSIKQKYLSNQIKTAIVIENADYTGGATTFYARNLGGTQLYPNQTAVYINGERLASDNLSISLEEDTNKINTDLWDKGEIVKFVATKTLTASSTQQIIIVTQYNGRDTFDFST